MEKYTPPKFDSFKDFYELHVKAISTANPDFKRLDGRETGGSRWPNAFFRYDGQLWKVDEDTHIRKLEIAYDLLKDGQDPFLITSTVGDKNKCLLIKGEPIRPRHFYVYLAQ